MKYSKLSCASGVASSTRRLRKDIDKAEDIGVCKSCGGSNCPLDWPCESEICKLCLWCGEQFPFGPDLGKLLPLFQCFSKNSAGDYA